MSNMRTSRTSSTAANALRLLTLLADYPRGAGVTELASRLGVGKSNVHLLLATLVAEGFASVHSGRYRLGFGVVRLAGAVDAREPFGGENLVQLKRLALRTGESVSVAVVSGRDAVIVERIESTERLRAEIRVGTAMPLFASASGKLLLAYSHPALVDEMYQGEELPHSTERAFTTKSELKRALDEVRGHGYATSEDEFTVGVTAIAAPIRDFTGEVVAALSVAGPTPRFRPLTWEDDIVATAREMSIHMGWSTSRADRSDPGLSRPAS